MMYKAKYGQKAYELALKQAKFWAEADNYYRKPHGLGAAMRGREKHGYLAGAQGGFSDKPEAYPYAPGHVSQLQWAQWMSCTGNCARFNFYHELKEVVLEINSARHGIPEIPFEFRTIEPMDVILYKTQEPSWKWFETLDDHI